MISVCPASSSAEQMVLPMYPAPPVTRTFVGVHVAASLGVLFGCMRAFDILCEWA